MVPLTAAHGAVRLRPSRWEPAREQRVKADPDRRGFLRTAVLGAAAVGVGGSTSAAPAIQVDRRPLGRLGAEVGILGLGLGSQFVATYQRAPAADRDAVKAERYTVLEKALEFGINYWDTATDYGPSQELLGDMVARVRDRVFLVSKSAQRTYDGYMRELEASLRLLKTDHLDLYHCHNIGSNALERDTMAALEDGCIRAARAAREQGLIRHFGCSGHTNAGLLIDFIRRFDPDAVLTVFPASRPDGGKYEDELLPLAVERKMGVIAMKTVRQAGQTDLRGSDLIRYALSLPGVCTAIVGLDTVEHLTENATMASGFTPLTRAEQVACADYVGGYLKGQTPPWLLPGYRDAVA